LSAEVGDDRGIDDDISGCSWPLLVLYFSMPTQSKTGGCIKLNIAVGKTNGKERKLEIHPWKY
jgi:hypothetical protein